MDSETNEILTNQQLLKDLVNHQGWKIVRTMIADRLLELNDIQNIDDRTASTMLSDLRARKKAVALIYGVLQDVEGTASQSSDNTVTGKSHIVDLE
jgi:hypothetical protein